MKAGTALACASCPSHLSLAPCFASDLSLGSCPFLSGPRVAVTSVVMAQAPRNLAGRAFAFSAQLLAFVEVEQRRRTLSARVLDQLLRAGTAIGAHTAEAESAITRRQLLALRAGALKEAHETRYWLELIASSGRSHTPAEVENLRAGVSELIAILTTCVKKLRS